MPARNARDGTTEPYSSTTGWPPIAYMLCPRAITWPIAGSIVNVELWPYAAAEDRAADRLAAALASDFSSEAIDTRSPPIFIALLLALCASLATVCASLAHRPEPPPPAEGSAGVPSPLGEAAADALSAAPLPAQSTASFSCAAAAVACSPASVSLSAANDALAACSIPSLVVTDCSACCTADGGVPAGTRMLDAPA